MTPNLNSPVVTPDDVGPVCLPETLPELQQLLEEVRERVRRTRDTDAMRLTSRIEDRIRQISGDVSVPPVGPPEGALHFAYISPHPCAPMRPLFLMCRELCLARGMERTPCRTCQLKEICNPPWRA